MGNLAKKPVWEMTVAERQEYDRHMARKESDRQWSEFMRDKGLGKLVNEEKLADTHWTRLVSKNELHLVKSPKLGYRAQLVHVAAGPDAIILGDMTGWCRTAQEAKQQAAESMRRNIQLAIACEQLPKNDSVADVLEWGSSEAKEGWFTPAFDQRLADEEPDPERRRAYANNVAEFNKRRPHWEVERELVFGHWLTYDKARAIELMAYPGHLSDAVEKWLEPLHEFDAWRERMLNGASESVRNQLSRAWMPEQYAAEGSEHA